MNSFFFLFRKISNSFSHSLPDEMVRLVFSKRIHYFLTFHSFLALFNLFLFLGSDCTFALATSIFAFLNLLLCLAVRNFKLGPQFFNSGYLFLISLYSILISQTSPQHIITVWIISLFSPILVMIFTSSIPCLGFEVLFHILCSFLFYKKSLKNYLEASTIDQTVDEITSSTLAAILLCGALLITSHTLTTVAFEKVTQVKDEEIAQVKTSMHSLTHEMRNPLNGIMGNLQLALLEDLSDSAKVNIKGAKISGELLLHIVNNILDEGKAQFGELEIDKKPTKIHECFERVWSIASELLRNKNLQGHLKVEKGFPERLVVDDHRICQILMNLLGNAVKFTDKGHVSVTATWLKNAKLSPKCFEPLPFDEEDEGIFEKNQNVQVLTRRSIGDDYDVITINKKNFKFDEGFDLEEAPGVLKIEVCDTGCGITEEGMQKLFQKYSQVNNSASKRKAGTGLGLYITKNLVEKMNGEIHVYSKYGKGTCFTICIPTESKVLPRASSANSLNSLSNEVEKQQMRALVIDNSGFNQKIFRRYLQKLGFKDVFCESDSIGALSCYDKVAKMNGTIDFIVVGKQSSLIESKETVRLIREFETNYNVKESLVIMVAQNGEVISKPNEVIPYDYLLREPVCFGDFFKIVQDNLGRFSGLSLQKTLNSSQP